MQDEKKRILKLVEEGKITASEALSLLELLEEETKQNSEKEKEIVNDLSTVVILDEEEKKEQETKKFNNQAELFKIVVEFKAGQ